MFTPETTAFVEGGSALIVGSVALDGAPAATRGWGLTILDPENGEARLLLDADDEVSLGNLRVTGAIAITATDVPTLRSLQMKGRVVAFTPSTASDNERLARYCDEFFTDIEEIDQIPRELPGQLVPDILVACTVRIDELFDQTPGPSAGARVEPASG